MNDELKEIIQQLKNGITYSDNICECDAWLDIGKYDAKKLLDYITNLQQENERLKMNIEAMKHNYNLLVTLIENGESITQKFENSLKGDNDE